MKVIIIGAGLGGLACAIACRQEGLDVLLLERAPQLLPLGAGIQCSSNATRIARRLGIHREMAKKATEPERLEMRRYDNGKILYSRPGREVMIKQYGAPWYVIHRADYHEIMLEEAKRVGVEIRLDCDVEGLDFERTEAVVTGGERIGADVIIGADGLWSTTRESLLGHPSPAVETGDLAYRATLTRSQLQALNDPEVDALAAREVVTTWIGPNKHTVFYPLRNGTQYNLVLLRPDDMPAGARTMQGDVAEMRASFEGWHSVLTKMLSQVDSVLKWKLCHHDELETWTRGSIALLGDACHPTLPYQGQGAAMAVEDGATLGRLLGLLNSSSGLLGRGENHVPEILQLYETLRKERTTLNVQGAASNRTQYHLPDGPLQEQRDAAMAGGPNTIGWSFINPQYTKDLIGFDAVADGEQAFYLWMESKQSKPASNGSNVPEEIFKTEYSSPTSAFLSNGLEVTS